MTREELIEELAQELDGLICQGFMTKETRPEMLHRACSNNLARLREKIRQWMDKRRPATGNTPPPTAGRPQLKVTS